MIFLQNMAKKIQEYLYSGLYVISSSEIGDLSEFIHSKKLGYIIDDLNQLNVKNSIETFIQRKSTREQNINIFLRFYENKLKIDEYLKLINFI